jgi:hypothetical protein
MSTNFDYEEFENTIVALKGEREYQRDRWTEADSKGVHNIDSFLTYIRVYMKQAEELATLLPADQSDDLVKRVLRKIAALCCAACEQNGGMPSRATDPATLSMSRPDGAHEFPYAKHDMVVPPRIDERHADRPERPIPESKHLHRHIHVDQAIGEDKGKKTP